jgi:hypothetical protein
LTRDGVKINSSTATQILRGMVYSRLESGFTKQDIAAAVDSLAGEAQGNGWEKVVESRERQRGLDR